LEVGFLETNSSFTDLFDVELIIKWLEWHYNSICLEPYWGLVAYLGSPTESRYSAL
jgi:hypothetical protein